MSNGPEFLTLFAAVDKHGHIVVMPNQVLTQVIENATHIKDQAQHNAAIMDETLQLAQHNTGIMDEMLCLHEETAQLSAELLACPSTNTFAVLQTQITNLSAAIQHSHIPMLGSPASGIQGLALGLLGHM
jgi:hypothetical protein